MIPEKIHGDILLRNGLPQISDPVIRIPGKCKGQSEHLEINESILSKHFMLIGGTGCGKTNTFFHIVDQIKSQITNDDVMIIFDTKGDYFRQKGFFNPEKDSVISTSEDFRDISEIWNIFDEILIDGTDRRKYEANIDEISWGLFSESIEKNKSNPFFPNAARDLFGAMLKARVRSVLSTGASREQFLTNDWLRIMFNKLTPGYISDKLSKYDDLTYAKAYVGKGENSQGLGVMAELQNVVKRIFVDKFAENGSFSMTEFVRERGGKTLFIEYDLARGSVLTPIYKLLIDLALKEAMGRKADSNGEEIKKPGNVYIFCDEFKLLPSLQHIDDAVNFGRALGVKIFAGLQSINQLYENYGEAKGKNIAAGFSSVMSFRMNDADSRGFAVGLYGKNYVMEEHRTYDPEKRIGNVVEDWDLVSLAPGEAIIGLPNTPPFKFKFDLFRGGYNG